MDALAQVGQAAPDFALPDLSDKLHRLSDMRGKPVVINFWSFDCPHSERADRTIRSMQEQWGGEVLVWSIASNANEALEDQRAAAALREVAMVLRDPDQKVADQFGAVTTPHIFVVDEHGILRYAGGLDDVSFRQREPTLNYLEQAISRLMSGKDPDPKTAPPYGCAVFRRASHFSENSP